MRRHLWIALSVAATLSLTAAVELSMGRLPLGPGGRFGWWEGNIWSSEQSQRLADPYSFGDSVLNSLSDILMMCLGYMIATRSRAWASCVLAVVIEIGMLLWVRDSLMLNITMLVHPIDAIKAWQMGGQPVPH
jgi:uncharacterized protein DUF2585